MKKSMTLFKKDCIYYILLFTVILQNKVIQANTKIHIKSNHLIIQKSDFSAAFKDAVVLTFDNNIRLYSSVIKIHCTDISQQINIKEIIIPTRLTVIKNYGQEMVFANSGYFNNITQLLTLIGNVQILKKDNLFITNKLIYSVKFKI